MCKKSWWAKFFVVRNFSSCETIRRAKFSSLFKTFVTFRSRKFYPIRYDKIALSLNKWFRRFQIKYYELSGDSSLCKKCFCNHNLKSIAICWSHIILNCLISYLVFYHFIADLALLRPGNNFLRKLLDYYYFKEGSQTRKQYSKGWRGRKYGVRKIESCSRILGHGWLFHGILGSNTLWWAPV